MQLRYVLLGLVFPICFGAVAAADEGGDARLAPVEAWFRQLGQGQDRPNSDARLKPLENWFAGLRNGAAPVAPAAASPVELKLDRAFDSLKYLIFFTPGSARLGPNARKTVSLLVPNARKADKVVVTAGSDTSGDANLNEVLKHKRGDAIIAAFRKAGVTKPAYSVAIEPSQETVTTPSDAKAVWMPNGLEGRQRRALVDVLTATPHTVQD